MGLHGLPLLMARRIRVAAVLIGSDLAGFLAIIDAF
jgi:hypothetical protein